MRPTRLETRPFYRRATPSTRERFVEMRSLRAGYRRLPRWRTDVAYSCAHYTAYTNPTTRVAIASQALAYENFTVFAVIRLFTVA